MQSITNTVELKDAIHLLEVDHTLQGQLLKEQLRLTYESLKPVNILRSTLSDVTSSPNFTEDIVGTLIGLATGYLSKKIVVGTSGNIIRKLIGSVLQFGVTNVVSHHPDTIKSFGQFILQYIFPKKEMNTEQQ